MTTQILYDRPRLAQRYNRSLATIRRWEAAGIIPPPDGHVIDAPIWKPETVAFIDANLNAATTGRSAGYIKGRGVE
jgi:hypothetical protein